MKLKVVPQALVATRSSSRWGDLQQDEALLDLVRAEVTARGRCPRWTALRRLERALAHPGDDVRARLQNLCDALEYEGDLTASRGGVLHVSPVRAINLQDGLQRIISSLPSHRLRIHLPGELEVDGVRRLHRFDPTRETEARAALNALGGVVLSPPAWAGLTLAPIADRSWLDSLDQRLAWRPERAGSLDGDGTLDWQGLTLSNNGPRWRRNTRDGSRLWRARTSYGRWIWAWTTAGGLPSTVAFTTLYADDANRTLFALAREGGRPVSASVVRDAETGRLRLRNWLPRAEYRYLSCLASSSRSANEQEWTIPLANVDDVLETLGHRLGLDIHEEAMA